MIKSLMFAIALIGAPAYAAGEDVESTSVEIESTSEVVEATSEEDETFEIVDTEDDTSWVPKWFTGEAVAIFLVGLGYVGTMLKFVSSYKSLKISHSLTLTNVQNTLGTQISKVVNEKIGEVMDKYMPKLIEQSSKQAEVLKSFAEILVLQQENTPQSRVAILEVISKIGVVSTELVEESKQIIADAVAEIAVKKEELKTSCDEIVAANVEIA